MPSIRMVIVRPPCRIIGPSPMQGRRNKRVLCGDSGIQCTDHVGILRRRDDALGKVFGPILRPNALRSPVEKRFNRPSCLPDLCNGSWDTPDESGNSLGRRMNENHRGVGKEGVGLRERLATRAAPPPQPLRRFCRSAPDPKFPPQWFDGRGIDFADKQGLGIGCTDGLDFLEPVHIGAGLIALRLPVGANATLQESTGIIRHKE